VYLSDRIIEEITMSILSRLVTLWHRWRSPARRRVTQLKQERAAVLAQYAVLIDPGYEVLVRFEGVVSNVLCAERHRLEDRLAAIKADLEQAEHAIRPPSGQLAIIPQENGIHSNCVLVAR
jgi:hypothetical protein